MDLRRPSKMKWMLVDTVCRKSPFWICLCGISMFSLYSCGLFLYYGFLPWFKNLQISSSGNLLVWMVCWPCNRLATCPGFTLYFALWLKWLLVGKFSFRMIMNNIVYSGMYLSAHHSHPSRKALPGHILFRLSIPLWTITGFTLVISVYAFKLRSSLLKIREKGMRGSYNFLEMKNYSVD